MTRQRFLAKQQCVENVIVVDAHDVTRNRAVSLDCACSAEIVYCMYLTRGIYHVVRVTCQFYQVLITF